MLPASMYSSNRPSVEPRVKLLLVSLPLLPSSFNHHPLPPLTYTSPKSPVSCLQARVSSASFTCVSPRLLIRPQAAIARDNPSRFLRHQSRIMSDGIAPAVDKVGPPASTAPEAEAGAPTMAMDADTAKPETTVNLPTSLEKPKEPPIIAETLAPAPEEPKPTEDPLKLSEALKRVHHLPRPVEVQSVPETPVNLSTPVNGSPRPELNIPVEPEEPAKPEEEPVIITEAEGRLPTPTASATGSDVGPDSIVDKPAAPNGESKAAELMAGALEPSAADAKSETSETATGEKRKADVAVATATDEPAAEKESSEESEPADKKAKIDNGKATNGGARKPGRPKKDKKAAPVVGKTLRKTRSQGPVEI
ncbi:hypothetical protein V8C35DRAFT_314949 [Trichoderma chlorosporum]